MKEKLELLHLDRVKKLIKDFPEGSVEKSEKPDFIVKTNNGKYGIELTMLFPEANEVIPPQAQEITKNKIVEQAGNLYNKEKLKKIDVSVQFSPHYTIGKRHVNDLSLFIVKWAKLNSIKLIQHFEVYEEDNFKTNTIPFPVEINSISMFTYTAMKRSYFKTSHSTWLPTLTILDIERAISIKNQKISHYQKMDEMWLVITTNLHLVSGSFSFDQDVLKHIYNSNFTRIFIHLYIDNQCYELHVGQ